MVGQGWLNGDPVAPVTKPAVDVVQLSGQRQANIRVDAAAHCQEEVEREREYVCLCICICKRVRVSRMYNAKGGGQTRAK